MRATKKIIFFLVGFSVLLSGVVFAAENTDRADELVDIVVDVFLEKMVEKDIFTEKDADEVSVQIRKEVKKRAAKLSAENRASRQGRSEVKGEEAQPSGLRYFVDHTDIKGDLRLRYQVMKEEDDEDARIRYRVRYRLGLETELIDDVKVGAGLTSGGANPRSTNQTLGSSFDTPDIRLDYAYASWKPVSWLYIIGGKFKNPIYRQPDFLWDSDIRPEGVAIKLQRENVMPGSDWFINSGFFVLDEESASKKDPFMWYIQPGLDWKVSASIDTRLAAIYYGLVHERNRTFSWSSGTNTLENGGLKYNYDALGLNGEVWFGTGHDILPYVGFYGEYIQNIDPDDEDAGLLGGARIGHKKVKEQGAWQIKAYYRYLERDAWLDFLTDSDPHHGETNTRGWGGNVYYGLNKNILLYLTYIYTERMAANADAENNFHANVMLKF